MSREIDIAQPEGLIEEWPGKYDAFSWLEYVVTVSDPIFIVTTRKTNGAHNASLQSWGMLIGEKGNYSSLMGILDHSHTAINILREGEWCIGFPSFQHYPQCFENIHCNGPDSDEIADAGLTAEPAKTVRAPRIVECPVTLECRLEWHRPLYDRSRWHIFAGRVLHLAMDEAVMVTDPVERMRAIGLMYNVRGTVDPLNREQYGPNTLGLLSKVEKVFPAE
jgi:flavin reductase (DIM6/NTAB) family NADH-FMN oxidoreductase RutF